MADLKEFLSLLESTVKAPRLSGSKVSLLSTQSKKLEPKSDTEFISTFLRLNKSLGKKSTSRISSLYVFDAIARANKGISGREGLMMKMEGVVDSWVNEMCEDGKGGVWTEGRDKTRKIVDIWTKSSTFPQPCLDRLSARLAVASADHSTTPTMSPPRPIMSPALPPLEEKENRGLGAHGFGQGTPPTSTPPPVPPGSLPPEIQKLLGISAQSAGAALNGSASQGGSTTAGGVDLATILAGIAKPQPQPQPQPQPSAPSHGSQPISTTPAAGAVTLPNPLASLNFDPNQLAALASLAAQTKQQSSAPLPTPVPGPNVNAGFNSLPRPPAVPYNGPHAAHGSQGPHGSPPLGGSNDQRALGFGPGPSRRDSRDSGGPVGTGRYGSRSSPSPPRDGYPPRRYGEGQRDRFNRQRPRSRSPPGRYGRGPPGPPPPGQGWQDGPRGSGGGPDLSQPPASQESGRWGDGGGGHNRTDSWERDDRSSGRGGFGGGRERGRGGGGGGGGGRGGRGGPGGYGRGRDDWDGGRDGFGGLERGFSGPSSAPVDSMGQGPGRGSANLPTVPDPQASGRGGRVSLPVQPGKDEFGRDLPSGTTQDEGEGEEEDMALDDSDDERPKAAMTIQNPKQTAHDQPPSSGLGFGPPGSMPAVNDAPHAAAQPASSVPNLDSFDRTTFNPADPNAWSTLAQAWQASMGREPNQMELMEWLATGMVGGFGMMGGVTGGGMNQS